MKTQFLQVKLHKLPGATKFIRETATFMWLGLVKPPLKSNI